MSRPPIVAAAVLVAATVTLTTRIRRRPRPVAAPAGCTHLPMITTYAVLDFGGDTAPVLQWCCEDWWLTYGQTHASYCQTVRGC